MLSGGYAVGPYAGEFGAQEIDLRLEVCINARIVPEAVGPDRVGALCAPAVVDLVAQHHVNVGLPVPGVVPNHGETECGEQHRDPDVSGSPGSARGAYAKLPREVVPPRHPSRAGLRPSPPRPQSQVCHMRRSASIQSAHIVMPLEPSCKWGPGLQSDEGSIFAMAADRPEEEGARRGQPTGEDNPRARPRPGRDQAASLSQTRENRENLGRSVRDRLAQVSAFFRRSIYGFFAPDDPHREELRAAAVRVAERLPGLQLDLVVAGAAAHLLRGFTEAHHAATRRSGSTTARRPTGSTGCRRRARSRRPR